jgi:hypothetical protein
VASDYPPNAIIDPKAEALDHNEKHRGEVELRPVNIAPYALRHDVWRLWVCYSSLHASPLEIAGLIRMWVDLHGLTIEDARSIIYSMMAPAVRASAKFPGDVTAILAGKVDSRLKWAKADAEQRERSQLIEKAKADRVQLEPGELAAMAFPTETVAASRPPTSPKHNEAFLEAAREQNAQKGK